MTLAAQGSVFAVGVQAAKVGREGTFDPSVIDYYKMRAPRILFGTVQNQQVFPLETGGPLTPDGAFKAGVYPAGEVDLIPRLINSFGFLLLGAMGAASSVTGVNADAVNTANVNTHIFRFDPSAPAAQPWLSVRRMVPGVTSGQNFGETAFDCKINSLRFTIPNAGKVACRVSMVGRDIVYDDASTWAYANANFENSETTPDAGAGKFIIGGEEYPIIGASIDIMNNLSTPDQEMVIGDFRPDDFIALSRVAQIRIVYKYENSELYRKLLTGEANGTEWSALPFANLTDGNGYGFDARFEAPRNIGATAAPYELRVRANRVVWAVEGPIETQAGGIITQTFVGTVLQPTDGSDYLQVVLVNGETSYAA